MSFRSRRIYVVFVLAVAMLVITVVLFRNTAMYRHDYVTNPLLRDGLDHVRTKVSCFVEESVSCTAHYYLFRLVPQFSAILQTFVLYMSKYVY